MMTAIFLFMQVSLFGTIQLPEKMAQESVFIKHSSKIVDHGYFTFCSIEGDTIEETIFSYSLNLKKQTFAVSLVDSDSASLDKKGRNYLSHFSNSEDWNRERVGTSVEKYFLIFDSDFLRWNNSEKMSFFLSVCKSK